MVNPFLIDLIEYLKEKSNEENVRIWKDIAKRLSKQRVNVNLSKINRHTSKEDQVLIAGKVLGSGRLNHPVTVAAFNFSKSAKEKIEQEDGKAISIRELSRINPKGTGVKIIK